MWFDSKWINVHRHFKCISRRKHLVVLVLVLFMCCYGVIVHHRGQYDSNVTTSSTNINRNIVVTIPKPTAITDTWSKPTAITDTRGKDVLIFGYMRGGTTLTGEYFRNSPGVFYVFEPISPFAPYDYFTNNSLCHMRLAKCEDADKSRMNGALNTLYNIYTCHIHKLPNDVIDNIVKQNKSAPAWYKFGYCLNSTKNGSEDRTKCYEQINEVCRTSDIRVTKVLRLGFDKIRSLLDRFPYLNILFMLRDPRAILNSRIQTDWFPVNENETFLLKSNVDSLCKKMLGDFNGYKHLQSKYKERLQQVWIHNVTKDESSMTNLLYFYRLNYILQKQDREFLDKVFEKKDESALFRDWTMTLKPEYIKYTEQKCLQFYKVAMPDWIPYRTM